MKKKICDVKPEIKERLRVKYMLTKKELREISDNKQSFERKRKAEEKLKIMKEIRKSIANIHKANWSDFKSNWVRKLELAAKDGKYSATLYYLGIYDMPKINNNWQSFVSINSPKISSETLCGTGKRIFNFLKRKGLEPELEIIHGDVQEYDDGGMNSYYWGVAIKVSW